MQSSPQSAPDIRKSGPPKPKPVLEALSPKPNPKLSGGWDALGDPLFCSVFFSVCVGLLRVCLECLCFFLREPLGGFERLWKPLGGLGGGVTNTKMNKHFEVFAVVFGP